MAAKYLQNSLVWVRRVIGRADSARPSHPTPAPSSLMPSDPEQQGDEMSPTKFTHIPSQGKLLGFYI